MKKGIFLIWIFVISIKLYSQDRKYIYLGVPDATQNQAQVIIQNLSNNFCVASIDYCETHNIFRIIRSEAKSNCDTLDFIQLISQIYPDITLYEKEIRADMDINNICKWEKL